MNDQKTNIVRTIMKCNETVRVITLVKGEAISTRKFTNNNFSTLYARRHY